MTSKQSIDTIMSSIDWPVRMRCRHCEYVWLQEVHYDTYTLWWLHGSPTLTGLCKNCQKENQS